MYSLELLLLEPDKIYFSGEELKGEVRISLSERLPVQAITIKIIGEACVSVPEEIVEDQVKQKRKNASNKVCPEVEKSGKVSCWVPTSPAKRSLRHKVSMFSSQEKYFVHKEFLYGHKYSSYREQLWSGQHVFPFSYTLPAQVPASFAGRYGYVRYFCEAALMRWSVRDTRRAYFSVTHIADLNQEPKAESGCEEQKTTNSCLFCCPKGTIVACAELKRRGYAPGEIAPLSVEVHNMSNTTISSLKAVVIQTVGYMFSQGLRHHDDNRSVLEVCRGKVRPGDSFSWGSAGVRIPPLPPTSFAPDSCKIINIGYRIEVMLYLMGRKEPMILRLPLIVGNIPLKRNFEKLEIPNEFHVQLPRNVTSRYQWIPGMHAEESINPLQSDCIYKLPPFRPRYLTCTPRVWR